MGDLGTRLACSRPSDSGADAKEWPWKTPKKSWRGRKKEKGRDREPVIISFTPLFHRPSSPEFLPVFLFYYYFFFMFALSQFSGPASQSLEQAKYDRPHEAFKSEGYLNCYSVSPITGPQLTRKPPGHPSIREKQIMFPDILFRKGFLANVCITIVCGIESGPKPD